MASYENDVVASRPKFFVAYLTIFLFQLPIDESVLDNNMNFSPRHSQISTFNNRLPFFNFILLEKKSQF